VDRAFCFIDLCGFTRFTDEHGDQEAVDVLTRFRAAVRETASDHAVRVDKWLGDGVMLVSTDDDRLIATALELARCGETYGVTLPMRAGLAAGAVILLEGDDYVGSSVNLAARLCNAAAPHQLLATLRLAAAVTGGADVIPVGALDVPGFVQPVEVARIEVHTLIAPS
jgi:adenylate cyclase